MTTIKKFDLSGKEVGEVAFDDAPFALPVSKQLIKDYIVAIRANKRQWSASTKTRAEVAHTTKKPYKQKGTGNARHGNLVGPQFRGGGIAFGPRPKFDQHVRINQKERRQALRFLIGEKIKENRLFIVDDKVFSDQIKKPKTKSVAEFLKKLKIDGRAVLFVGDESVQEVETEGKKLQVATHTKKHETFKLSSRNIPKAAFSLAPHLNGYDVLVAHNLVMSESAFDQLQKQLL